MFLDGKFKTTGRTILTEKGLMMLSSADTLEFNADCEEYLRIYLDCVGESDVYFTLYIDSKRQNYRFHVSEGANVFIPLVVLEKGIHNFKLVRQTEWGRGDIYVTGVDIKGEIVDQPVDKKLFIEFVGDSLATGFGNQPNEKSEIEWGGASIYQDATKAYPYLCADALDADLSVVAIQGIGALCGGWEFTMNDVYEIYPRLNEKDYIYMPQRAADIVVVHLLGNDRYNYEENGYTVDDIMDKAEQLCRMIRAKHPDSIVIFSPADFCEEGAKMVEEKLGGAANGYYSIVLYMDTLGKGSHPSEAGHRNAADILVPFINKILEEKGITK